MRWLAKERFGEARANFTTLEKKPAGKKEKKNTRYLETADEEVQRYVAALLKDDEVVVKQQVEHQDCGESCEDCCSGGARFLTPKLCEIFSGR